MKIKATIDALQRKINRIRCELGCDVDYEIDVYEVGNKGRIKKDVKLQFGEYWGRKMITPNQAIAVLEYAPLIFFMGKMAGKSEPDVKRLREDNKTMIEILEEQRDLIEELKKQNKTQSGFNKAFTPPFEMEMDKLTFEKLKEHIRDLVGMLSDPARPEYDEPAKEKIVWYGSLLVKFELDLYSWGYLGAGLWARRRNVWQHWRGGPMDIRGYVNLAKTIMADSRIEALEAVLQHLYSKGEITAW